MTSGELLKKRRLDKYISQEELAKWCKVSQVYISNIESGKKNLNYLRAQQIAGLLDLTYIETCEFLNLVVQEEADRFMNKIEKGK